MNNHADIRKQLSAYCGGDLEPAERVLLEEHLAGCSSCQAELADLQTALRLIRTTPESEPPPWLAARIMARVREQQRTNRSWLQRVLFPLHIKLPIEVAALLLVCVSGYYLARNVETELQQPAIQQELSAAAPETGKTAVAPEQEAPAAALPTPAPPPPATKKEFRPDETMLARPSESEAENQVAPQHVPEAPAKPSPQPVFAPAPPVMMEGRGASPTEPLYGGAQSSQPSLGVKSAKKAKKVAKIKELDMAASEEARGASDAPAGATQPQVVVRLDMIAPASAPGSLKEAVTRSGGSIIDDGLLLPKTIKARIPSVRMGELLERLERIGRVVERPQTRDLPGMVEIEIIW